MDLRNLAPGSHTVRIECTGRARAGALGTWVSLDTAEVNGTLSPAVSPIHFYEETDPNLLYTGPWTSTEDADASSGALKRTRTAGTALDVAFEGTALKWTTYRNPYSGIATVTVDGGTPFELDLYSSAREFKATALDLRNLAPGSHTVRIECTGRARAGALGTWVKL